jgi:hypothetical protein
MLSNPTFLWGWGRLWIHKPEQQIHAGIQFPEEGLSAFRPCSAVCLPVGGEKLWKSLYLESLFLELSDPSGSKHMG